MGRGWEGGNAELRVRGFNLAPLSVVLVNKENGEEHNGEERIQFGIYSYGFLGLELLRDPSKMLSSILWDAEWLTALPGLPPPVALKMPRAQILEMVVYAKTLKSFESKCI